jgi:hypothetical protein
MTYAHSANRCVRFLRLVLAVTLARPDSSISVNELQRASPGRLGQVRHIERSTRSPRRQVPMEQVCRNPSRVGKLLPGYSVYQSSEVYGKSMCREESD